MINQIIDDIVSAENEADTIKKNAEIEASKIEVSLAGDIEELKKEYYEKTKLQIEAINAQAQIDADVAFNKRLSTADDEAQTAIKKAEKIAQKVSDGIFNKMVKLSNKK